MCGIAGMHAFHPCAPTDLERAVRRMTSRLVHRGPDDDGYFTTSSVSLGSRRLKIIDLSGGRMPISNESGSVQVVYNGEIYNYRRLRVELMQRGHRLETDTDTEVLVHLYEDEGIDFVHRLVGMFAFALWDDERKALYLVRDRLGIKPLYYRQTTTSLQFASELTALVAGAEESHSIDLTALSDYLAFGYVRAPRTIYEDCRKLPPGCILQSSAGNVTVAPYWTYPNRPASPPPSIDAALEELDDLLRTAVSDRLVADVPVGAFLSGGVDSSLVVALAARAKSGPLATFSVGFDGDDELRYARRVADLYGTDHHELTLAPDDCQILDKLVDAFDEPFGDDSAIPTYFVSQLARTEVTVSLSGDGGDELFAGYDRYLWDARRAWIDRIPRTLRQATLGLPGALLPPGAYGVNLLRLLPEPRDVRYTMSVATELDPRRGGLLRADMAEAAPKRRDLLATEFRAAAALPYPARLQYVDAVTYLPDDILTKVDRMSMVHSLEARVPLLDHRVVEFVARLPSAWRVYAGQGKWLLKRLAERYVPPEILYRPKRGFSLPIGTWMRGPMRRMLDELLEPDAHVRQFLDRANVERLLREHHAGRRDHSEVLWRVLVLERWIARTSSASARTVRGSNGNPSGVTS